MFYLNTLQIVNFTEIAFSVKVGIELSNDILSSIIVSAFSTASEAGAAGDLAIFIMILPSLGKI